MKKSSEKKYDKIEERILNNIPSFWTIIRNEYEKIYSETSLFSKYIRALSMSFDINNFDIVPANMFKGEKEKKGYEYYELAYIPGDINDNSNEYDDEADCWDLDDDTKKTNDAQKPDKLRFKFLPIELKKDVLDDINNGPIKLVITRINTKDCNIELPLIFKNDNSVIDYVKKKVQPYNLSEKAKKTLVEFLTFKLQSEQLKDRKPEGLNTYYNLLLYGSDMGSVNDIQKIIVESLGIPENAICSETEEELRGGLGKKIDSILEKSFKNLKLIYIYNCSSVPYVDADAGHGGELEKAKERFRIYNEFWSGIAEYSKRNPSVTFILGMSENVYNYSFKNNNELNHRIFGHRMEIEPISIDFVIDYCNKKFAQSSIGTTENFNEEFEKYVRTIYRRADLKGIPFADDAINRVYSYYFRKKVKKDSLIDVDCIPPYDTTIRSAKELLSKFDDLIGLDGIKEELEKIYIQNMMNPTVSAEGAHHMMFLGSPGTGKTTVAKLMAEYFCQAGIIKTPNCVEASAKDLISHWRGNTAHKTMELINKAMDGVLFIDEAYQLAEKSTDNASDALNVFLTEMVKRKKNLIIIFAGYEAQMQNLLKMNPGLASRIPYQIHFKDFNDEELTEIFLKKMSGWGFTLDESAKEVLEECIHYKRMDENFANARTMEELAVAVDKNWCIMEYNSAKSDIEPEKKITAKHFEGLIPTKKIPQISDLVGLKSVKEKLQSFEEYVKFRKELKKVNKEAFPDFYMHMIFRGNPGTGKTTVAKMIADDLYSFGILKTNHLVVAERKDIIVPGNGMTAKNVNELIQKAMGGVLFIDEAYALAEDRIAGPEAIETLITAMVDYKDDMIFIFAGYPENMSQFLRINPGIPSRIGYYFDFEDYTAEELLEIFDKKMSEAGFKVNSKAKPKVKEVFEYFSELPRFGNGRFVEKFVSECLMKRSKRDYSTKVNFIEPVDIPEIEELQEMVEGGKYLINPKNDSKETNLRVAYHELGHAIVSYELDKKRKMKSISIKGRALSGGRVSFEPSYENMTRKELLNEMAIALAGRVSETIFTGDYDTGCRSDYGHAKNIAKSMIIDYGMTEEGETVRSLIKGAEKRAEEVITKYKKCIEVLTKELIAGAEFTGDEFYEKVKQIQSKKK